MHPGEHYCCSCRDALQWSYHFWRSFLSKFECSQMPHPGKVAIVTALTQGIGFSIAERLGLEGASVVVSSRRQNNVDEAVEKLRARGIEVLGVVCHVSNAQQRKNLIEPTVQKYGKIDVIVSNAAVNPSVDTILETKEAVLDKLWEINVKAAILLLQMNCSSILSRHVVTGSEFDVDVGHLVREIFPSLCSIIGIVTCSIERGTFVHTIHTPAY